MANTQGIPTYPAFRTAAMAVLYVTSGVKAALYLSSASVGPSTTAYTATGEASGSGYSAGGVAVTTTQAPQISGSVTYWTPAASIVYTTITTSEVDAIMLYDDNASDRSLGVFTFTAATPVAGTLTLSMPTDNSTTALVRWTWS